VELLATNYMGRGEGAEGGELSLPWWCLGFLNILN
jgi:hypothetical protein